MNTNIKLIFPYILVAIALIASGIEHFILLDFVTGRSPAWPEGVGGRIPIAVISGTIFIAGAIAILLKKYVRSALIICGTLILIGAGFRNIFLLISNPEYAALLTSTLKGLTMGSGLFILAKIPQSGNDEVPYNSRIAIAFVMGIIITGLFLLVSGMQHFLFADFVKFLVPSFIPGAAFWTYFSGVALITAGAGILSWRYTAIASLISGWMVFSWVFLLHLPRAIINNNQSEWMAVFEAIMVSGILLAISNRTTRTDRSI